MFNKCFSLRSIEKIPFHKKRKRSQSLSSYNSSEVQCFSSSHFLAALLHSTMAGLVGSSEVEVRPSSSTLLPLWWQRGISKERMNKNPGSRDRQHNWPMCVSPASSPTYNKSEERRVPGEINVIAGTILADQREFLHTSQILYSNSQKDSIFFFTTITPYFLN